MTDDDVWAELRRLRSDTSTIYYSSLMDRLGAGPEPGRVGGEHINWPSSSALNTGANTMGNVRSFIGQTNLLDDPAFESLSPTVAPVGTSPGTFGMWTAEYVLNSGATSGVNLIQVYERGHPNNPFNSAMLGITVSFAAAGDLDVYLYPTTDLVPGEIPILPFLVPYVWLYKPDLVALAYPDIEVTMELYDVTDSVVVAASDPYDAGALAMASFESHQIFTSYTVPDRFHDYRWRFKAHVADDPLAGPTTAYIYLGEPSINFTYTADPLPFMPAIGGWQPYVDDDHVVFSDITTGDVSVAAHGFAPISSGVATEYLDGTGGYSTPPSTPDSGLAAIVANTATSSTTEKQIVAASLAAGEMAAGTTFHIHCTGRMTTAGTGGNATTTRVRIGTTTLTGNVPVSLAQNLSGSSDDITIDAYVTVRTTGSGGTATGNMRRWRGTGGALLFDQTSMTGATVVVATNAAKIIELTVQMATDGVFTAYTAVIEKVKT